MNDMRFYTWQPWDRSGIEHLTVHESDAGIMAGGTFARITSDPFLLNYELTCDPHWFTRSVRVRHGDHAALVHLVSDGLGHWADADGTPRPELTGCVDVDISATPFTNTLPIRRLRLQPGEIARIAVVYIDVPTMTVSASRQRYRCLHTDAGGAQYEFTSLDDDFSAILPVDAHGIVGDYPDLFRALYRA